jgi:hypothetical protein
VNDRTLQPFLQVLRLEYRDERKAERAEECVARGSCEDHTGPPSTPDGRVTTRSVKKVLVKDKINDILK